MTFTVVLPGTVFANVAYKWLVAGVWGSELTAGITDTGEFYAFVVNATPPVGAQEIVVYDATDHSNFAFGRYQEITISADVIADAILNRNIAGGSSSGRLVKDAFAFLRNKWAITATTLTVYGTDDSTPLWTLTITGDNTAAPVVGSDPT